MIFPRKTTHPVRSKIMSHNPHGPIRPRSNDELAGGDTTKNLKHGLRRCQLLHRRRRGRRRRNGRISSSNCRLKRRRQPPVPAISGQVHAARSPAVAGLRVVAAAYVVRIFAVQGFYLFSYALAIYVLSLVIAFLSPQADFAFEGLGEEEDDEAGPLLPV